MNLINAFYNAGHLNSTKWLEDPKNYSFASGGIFSIQAPWRRGGKKARTSIEAVGDYFLAENI